MLSVLLFPPCLDPCLLNTSITLKLVMTSDRFKMMIRRLFDAVFGRIRIIYIKKYACVLCGSYTSPLISFFITLPEIR